MATILGLGTAVPEVSISREQSINFARQLIHNPGKKARILPNLYRMTSVESRGSVLLRPGSGANVDQSFYNDASSSEDRGPTTASRIQRYATDAGVLATRAARQALDHANVQPSQITHLVLVSCTGFQAPGIDIDLIENLDLPLETERVVVGFMGCHGAVNGIRTANGLATANPNAIVLVVCVELCSLHFQYGWDTDRVVSNALFSDGSGALVVGGSEKKDSAVEIAGTGSVLIRDTRDAMTWKIGDHGFEMTLSSAVPGIIEEELPGFMESWLAKHKLTVSDIGGWAVHPGGPRIVTAVETCLALPEEHLQTSRDILQKRGNMSSGTILFILQEFWNRSQKRPWVALAFGPGLEVEIALIR